MSPLQFQSFVSLTHEEVDPMTSFKLQVPPPEDIQMFCPMPLAPPCSNLQLFAQV